MSFFCGLNLLFQAAISCHYEKNPTAHFNAISVAHSPCAQYGWGFRQLLKLVYPFSFQPRFSLVGYDEIFIYLNSTDWGADSGFDQNRLFAGFGWNFDMDRRITGEIGYLNQFIRKPSGADEMNHVLSINLLLNF
jgi:hypothetical protein